MKNQIASLVDDNGVEQFDEDAKGNIDVEYFTRLFQTSNPEGASELLHGFEARVTDIHRAVKEIRGDSAPGIDGMTDKFFQSFYKITRSQVVMEVKHFFVSGWFPKDWNHTQLFMRPKKSNPSWMTDLRPISLCSVAYKIVSKILCTRLKKILPQLVSQMQGVFVAGRLISGNLLIAHEMVHGLRMNPSCKEEFLAIKTDMLKAYDHVEWAFLEELFQRMGFDRK